MALAVGISALLTLLLTSAACTDRAEPTPDGGPSITTSSPTSSTPTSPSITPDGTPTAETVPAYLGKYSPQEQKAYRAAVKDRERFADHQAAIFRRSRATPQARTYYMRRTASWQTYWARLRQFDAEDITVKGRSKVIRVRPSKIRLAQDGSGTVTLHVCGSNAGLRVFQRGELSPQPNRRPSIVEVAMVKLRGESWWRVLYEKVRDRSC